jgi:serine phosphatase RsbU (regulator of sigma subunit)
MSLRTRLIVAFALLSVVPLSAVTLYSYVTSVHAFERAVEREASQSATDIGRRMAMVTDDVGRRVGRLFQVSAPQDQPGAEAHADPEAVRAQLAPLLGETAALLDRVEFEPAVPPAPAAGAPGIPSPPNPAGTAPPAPPPTRIVVDVDSILGQTRAQLKASGLPDTAPGAAAALEDVIRKSVAGVLARRETIEKVREAQTKAATAAQAVEASKGRLTGSSISRPEASPAPEPAVPVPMTVRDREIAIPVRRNGHMMGHASARLNMDRTLGAILALARSDQGEVAFAIDTRGRLYTPDERNRATLESLDVKGLAADERPRRVGDWIIVAHKDSSGLTFGIARPLGESLREIRRASVRNLSLGLGVIGLAIIGIVPISHGMTMRLRTLTSGVRRLASGDFAATVPVRSTDEFGELAAAFNQMARDLEQHQSLALERERLKRELELSRQIQTEMLPRAALHLGCAEIRGISIPAREVGGDFFNYFELPEGRLGLLVGDVSGKGVSAALLMANVQATLRARLPLQPDLAALADALDRELDASTPGGVFVTLFIGILEHDGRQLRYVNAGHNPQYVRHGDGSIEAMASTGLPLGLFSGHGYHEAAAPVAPGDLLFFYTDGLVETENTDAQMFGSERVEAILRSDHADGIDALLRRIERDVAAFRGSAEPLDDATIMAMTV